MYNKIFTKILDSSIWLESDATRIVWLTFLAAMDEDGFASFASVRNLAHRARVSIKACGLAVNCLESADSESSDPSHEGRRIERVPGGWVILNADKYRDLVTRTVSRERTRERVKRWREKRAGNGPVTASNVPVTQSEAVSEAYTETEAKKDLSPVRAPRSLTKPTEPEAFTTFWRTYPKKVGKDAARRAWTKHGPPLEAVLSSLEWQSRQDDWLRDRGQYIPHPATWLNRHGWEDEPFHAPEYRAHVEVKPGRGARLLQAGRNVIARQLDKQKGITDGSER